MNEANLRDRACAEKKWARKGECVTLNFYESA